MTRLHQNLFDHVGLFHAGEFFVKAIARNAQPAVIEPQQMQHGRVPVAHAHAIFDGGKAKIIRGAQRIAAFVSR